MKTLNELRDRFPGWEFRTGKQWGNQEIIAFIPGWHASAYVEKKNNKLVVFSQNAPVDVINAIVEWAELNISGKDNKIAIV